MSGWTPEKRAAQSKALKRAWARRKKASKAAENGSAATAHRVGRNATVPEQLSLMYAQNLLASVTGDVPAAKAAIDAMAGPAWMTISWEKPS